MNIKDIAKLANVSIKTVSNAINDKPGVKKETKDKILKIIEKTGYTVNYNAKRLSESKSKQISIVTNIVSDIPMQKNNIILNLIIDELKNYNYKAIVCNNISELKNKLFNKIEKGYFDGIILLNPENDESINFLLESKIPFIASGTNLECDFVGTDQKESGYISTQHLIDIGCQKIDFLLGTFNKSTVKDKIQGYKKALSENNIMYENINDGFYTSNSVEQYIISSYYNKKLPDGIIIDSDYPVFGAIRALKKLNLNCPNDIKIITFGDTFICEELTPSITAIKQDFKLLAHHLVNILLNKINDNNFQKTKIKISPTLIIRQSTIL